MDPMTGKKYKMDIKDLLYYAQIKGQEIRGGVLTEQHLQGTFFVTVYSTYKYI